MMMSFLMLVASAELKALDQAVAQCNRASANPVFSAEAGRRSQYLLDAYLEQESIVSARRALAERRRALREGQEAARLTDDERAITLAQAVLDDRQQALNDQRMLEGIRQQTIDAMRRHYLAHCAGGKSRN